jgi:hypothetical protein
MVIPKRVAAVTNIADVNHSVASNRNDPRHNLPLTRLGLNTSAGISKIDKTHTI